MMLARIVVVRVSARAKKIPGNTLMHSATSKSRPHRTPNVGSAIFRTLAMSSSVAAPKRHRPKATPNGVKKPSESFMKMKEQPHVTLVAMYVRYLVGGWAGTVRSLRCDFPRVGVRTTERATRPVGLTRALQWRRERYAQTPDPGRRGRRVASPGSGRRERTGRHRHSPW